VRIQHLSWEYPPLVYGGLGRHVHALAEAQAAAGHDVTVVTQHVDGAPLDERVGGVRVVRAPLDPPLIPPGDLLAWVLALNHGLTRAALRVAGPAVPDVVHAHDWVTCQAATTIKHALGLPLVATLHATEAGRHQGWLPSPLSRAIHTTEWWLTFEARRVITCSTHMRWEVTRLFELPPATVDVVPNGIDLDRWAVSRREVAAARTTYAGGGPLVVFSSRLEWEKGLHTLLDAMPRLRRRHPGLRLVVAGQGTMGESLRARAAERRLGRAVTFTGFLGSADLAALVAAADCAVVPSLYEPFGMVATEAAALGTPVVVADTGGLREQVEDGVTGVRFPPGDVARLADAVSSVLTDQVRARRMARRAREVVARDRPWAAIGRQTVEVYARAAEEERMLEAGLAARPDRSLRLVVHDGNLLTGEGGSPT